MTGTDRRTPLISVIAVNYNGRRLLDACLNSLAVQSLPPELFEVFVIDNASSDGSVEHLRAEYPWVRVHSLERNRGFAGGNNAGFRLARGEYLALINNDAEAAPECLEHLLTAIERSPTIGGVAAKLRFRHDQARINSAGLMLFRDGRGGDRGFRQPDFGQFDRPAEVFGVCAAGAMFRRELIDELGGFDERLFMYYEDLDLAWRARLRGWKFVYEPRAIVLHDHCGSSGEGSPFFCFHVERNRVLVSLKNGSPRLAALNSLGFAGRLARTGWRWTRGQVSAAHASAFLLAAGSIFINTPGVLRERLRVRSRRRTVPDSRITQLMSAAPARSL
jgi:GT2 family glycosyltransferase